MNNFEAAKLVQAVEEIAAQQQRIAATLDQLLKEHRLANQSLLPGEKS
mgnify:CR=1 FL=1